MKKKYLRLAMVNIAFLLFHQIMFFTNAVTAHGGTVITFLAVYIICFIFYGVFSCQFTQRVIIPNLMALASVLIMGAETAISLIVPPNADGWTLGDGFDMAVIMLIIFFVPCLTASAITKIVILILKKIKKSKEITE